ncbi:hypothetical protein N7513_005652 [Penicillium frequentans]|nr:hypothetical protein N7513_005652 [Penicillium glabrum]
MNSASFDGTNSGAQVGTNQGVINILPGLDQGEYPQQETNHEVLRSLAFPQMLDRRDNIEPCHTNTCQWILELEKYKSWRSQSCGLLWIKGKPGAGKSTLMAFLHEKLEILQDGRQGIRLDFFFSARGTEMQRSPLGMFRSLLNQIFDRDTTVRPQVREIYERRCRQLGYGRSKWEWPRSVLEGLLTGAVLTSADRQPVTVFVDALDEAGAESAQQLATYFHRLIDLARTKKAAVQICISCRHYPIIGNVQAIEINVEDHNGEDISQYIKDALTGTEVEDGFGQVTREAMIGQLVQQANGVFQWAHLMMPLVRRRMLEGESYKDTRRWLCEIPTGLEDVYTYILNEVIEDRNREESFLLFQWICLAEQPLTVTQLRDARMKRRIKALSGGLVEVVLSEYYHKGHETIQVVHQSVNDFLRTKGLGLLHYHLPGRKPPADGDNMFSQCQAVLYRSCMVYLATANLPRETFHEHFARELNQDFPLLHYAAFNLFIHAERAGGSRADAVPNELDMLQQVMGRWARAYEILHPYGEACPAKGTTLLHIAAATNLVDLIESMLSKGEDVAREDGNGSTAFHLAARGGHVLAGKVLLEKGADQDARCRNGMTPLIEAARHGNLGFVEWLLNNRASIERTADYAECFLGALQAAVVRGHRSVVEMLIRAGADVNAQGGEYGNALQAAAYHGSSEIVRMLLDAQANVNAQGGEYGNALQAAAYHGSTEIVHVLLDAQANVNAQGGEYGNALQAAASYGYTDIVRMLLNAQANVNAQGGEYGNALQAAAYHGSTETVQLLLSTQANVNVQGGKYGNALQAAAYHGSSKIVQMLLSTQANVNAQGGKYGNALQAAAYHGSTEIVHVLLDAQANVNAQGGEYGNALQAAASYGYTDIVRMLLNAQANVNAQGGEYGNALQAAAASFRNDLDILQMLLSAQANVNTQGGRYGNALQAAAYFGSTEIVRMLLDARADVNAQGGIYGNALQAASLSRAEGSVEVVRMLLDAQADVNAQGGEYGSALQAATIPIHENSDVVRMLLDAQANVNIQGGEYGNALQAAAYLGRSMIVQMLVNAGANVNTQGGVCGSGLSAAIHGSHPDEVQSLLDAGADVLLADEIGMTPLHIASLRNRLKIIHQFPQFASAVNIRDKLSRTPLHLAVHLRHIDFALMLLNFGADPSIVDGYGRNIMDWAQELESPSISVSNIKHPSSS